MSTSHVRSALDRSTGRRRERIVVTTIAGTAALATLGIGDGLAGAQATRHAAPPTTTSPGRTAPSRSSVANRSGVATEPGSSTSRSAGTTAPAGQGVGAGRSGPIHAKSNGS